MPKRTITAAQQDVLDLLSAYYCSTRQVWEQAQPRRSKHATEQLLARLRQVGLVAAYPLHPEQGRASAGLRVRRIRQLQDRMLAGADWQGEEWDLVFCTTRGTPLEARNLLRDFKKLLERAHLPDMRFHDLRHGAATLLLAKGVTERVVMEILGHSQLSQTMRYSHVIPRLQQEAERKLDELLTGEIS